MSTSFITQYLQNLQNPAMVSGGLKDLGSLAGSRQQTNPSGSSIPTGKVDISRGPIQAPPNQIQQAVNNASAIPVGTTASPTSTTTIPTPPLDANGVPTGTIKGGDLNSVYGVDTGTALTDLYNSEGSGTANSTAQAIINANAPNVAQGAATLNTGLANAGISPSSSVSALENSSYESGVQLGNLSEIAQVNLTEQGMQQQLLESLLPSQQQRQTDSSGWSIFGDILSGIGDVVGL